MARKYRTALMIGDTAVPEGLRPKHLTKQEFATRLLNAINKRGWSQSQLAREATLKSPNGAAISRDNVSTYVRASSLPSPAKVVALAAALGMDPNELLPNYAEGAIAEDTAPAFSMRTAHNAPGVAWVQVNRLVTVETATRIAKLLEDDKAIGNDNHAKPKSRR